MHKNAVSTSIKNGLSAPKCSFSLVIQKNPGLRINTLYHKGLQLKIDETIAVISFTLWLL
jgi:hypothetical protein